MLNIARMNPTTCVLVLGCLLIPTQGCNQNDTDPQDVHAAQPAPPDPEMLQAKDLSVLLEPVLEDLGARPGERQAIMVKHLVRFIKDKQTIPSVSSPVSIQPSSFKQIKHKK